jgi:hypothetical protein
MQRPAERCAPSPPPNPPSHPPPHPQAMLEAISLSQPQPKVPPELLRFLGKVGPPPDLILGGAGLVPRGEGARAP